MTPAQKRENERERAQNYPMKQRFKPEPSYTIQGSEAGEKCVTPDAREVCHLHFQKL